MHNLTSSLENFLTRIHYGCLRTWNLAELCAHNYKSTQYSVAIESFLRPAAMLPPMALRPLPLFDRPSAITQSLLVQSLSAAVSSPLGLLCRHGLPSLCSMTQMTWLVLVRLSISKPLSVLRTKKQPIFLILTLPVALLSSRTMHKIFAVKSISTIYLSISRSLTSSREFGAHSRPQKFLHCQSDLWHVKLSTADSPALGSCFRLTQV